MRGITPGLFHQYVITDSRKFVKMGIWRSLARCAVILFCHGLRLPIAGRAFFADLASTGGETTGPTLGENTLGLGSSDHLMRDQMVKRLVLAVV